MLEELKTPNKLVGIKQLRKALEAGGVKKVFIAENADPYLTAPLEDRCIALMIPVEPVPTMKQLGTACGISVPAAVAAIL